MFLVWNRFSLFAYFNYSLLWHLFYVCLRFLPSSSAKCNSLGLEFWWDLEMTYINFHKPEDYEIEGDLALLFTKQQILDLSRLKAFAANKINVMKKLKFALGRIENIMGKRRKCWLLSQGH